MAIAAIAAIVRQLKAQPLAHCVPQLPGTEVGYEPKQEWERGALKDLLETSLSCAEIGKRYNRHANTVRLLKQRAGVERPEPSRVGAVPLISMEPVSRVHRWIGLRLTLSESDEYFRETLNYGKYRFAQMKEGQHDFTLSELVSISEVLKIPLSELLEPPSKLKGVA